MIDELPDVAGIADRWGRSIFHCPYCHGYELEGGPIGVIATSAMSVHQALMLPDWGTTTYFTRGFEPLPEERAAIERRGTIVEPCPVVRIEERATVRLADDRVLSFAGLFLVPRNRIAGHLVADLGLETEDTPFGTIIKTDMNVCRPW